MVSLEVFALLLTGSGLIASILYYTFTLQNTNKTRQAQFLMQIYNKFDTPDKQKAFTEVWNWQWTSFEEFWEKYNINDHPEKWNYLLSLLMFYEALGTMIKTEKLPIDDVYLIIGGMSIHLWEKFIPILGEIRERMEYPRFASETEYLYNELVKYRDQNTEITP